MAVAYQVGAAVHKITAANDTHTKHVRLHGYEFSHTAAGSVTLKAVTKAGVAGGEVLIDKLGAAGSTGFQVISPPIDLPGGYIAANCTGTLLLYV